jgi:N-acetylmuramoyl-L-alanine amidase
MTASNLRTFGAVGVRAAGVMLAGLVLAGCSRSVPPVSWHQVPRQGDEIVAAGQMFHTGAPVVLWLDPKGYDAYNGHRHFDESATMPSNPVSPNDPNRYGRRRKLSDDLAKRVAEEGWTLANLQQQVDQFVIHYDVCGTSRQCFKVLHDVRGLSVHFMLDIDGTIYQTLDLKERAWHAGEANDRSVGIEIAQIGAYPNMKVLDNWYKLDETGWPYITLPSWMTDTGVRTPNFVGRPARQSIVTGRINGRDLMQYDYTPEQYASLVRLTAALARIFPNMRLDVPRAEDGSVRSDALSAEELAAWQGLLGHYHITRGKSDPGPAFDWDRLLRDTHRRLAWNL